MVIDYDKYPVLKKLHEDGFGNFMFSNDDYENNNTEKIISILKGNWNENKKYFSKEIFYISTPFEKLATSNAAKLSSLLSEDFDNGVNHTCQCTFLTKTHTYMVNIIINEKVTNIDKFFILVFDKQGVICACYNTGFGISDTQDFSKSWLSNSLGFNLSKEESESIYSEIIGLCLVRYLFKKYAKVETKTLFPARKEVIAGEKCLNNTDLNITHLDSLWFTNICKQEGFEVRGHFRLQPCKKDGEWTRELIWINDFEKHGYNRKAGITKNNEG